MRKTQNFLRRAGSAALALTLDMVKKLRENGTGRLPISLQKRKTEHFTASANDAFAVIRITARDNTEECCREVLNYLCELLEQEDFPRSYAVEFKGPEKRALPR